KLGGGSSIPSLAGLTGPLDNRLRSRATASATSARPDSAAEAVPGAGASWSIAIAPNWLGLQRPCQPLEGSRTPSNTPAAARSSRLVGRSFGGSCEAQLWNVSSDTSLVTNDNPGRLLTQLIKTFRAQR